MADRPAPLPLIRPRPIDRLTGPIRRFLAVQTTGGVVLAVATAVALAVANSPWAGGYHRFWHTHLAVAVGPYRLDHDLHFWVNDALMALFFYVVGLEIKRELVAGELSTARKAALPAVAALGGMAVPAAIYLALQPGGDAARGWGIPMATDIAFVVGVLAAFGDRVPGGLKVFLLALAIVDDIGAIVVIAVAYSGPPDGLALGLAAAGLGAVYGMTRLGVSGYPVYAVAAFGVWLAVYASGVHPTIAGVALGLVTPTRPWVGREEFRKAVVAAVARFDHPVDAGDGNGHAHPADPAGPLADACKGAVSPLERLEYLLHPWAVFVVMPIFALANAGVHVDPRLAADPVAVAVAVGLAVGKPAGIVGFSLLAVAAGLAELPAGVSRRALIAGGCLGGIGFTMSLFMAQLALPPDLLDAGKVGIMLGSVVSGAVGAAILLTAGRPDG